MAAVLPKTWNVDLGRLAAAVPVCRRRHSEGREEGWGEAAGLLDQAVRMVYEAGADTDADAREQFLGRLFPDLGPFQWDTGRRSEPLWWLRRLAAMCVRLVHQPSTEPAGVQRVVLNRGRRSVGQVDYQVCERCQRGYLLKISVDGAAKGYGIGTRTVLKLYRRHPELTWYTTTQYDTAGTFWHKIARRTGGVFAQNHDGACEHMKTGRRN
ncbi:hypothetical protein AB0C01_07140 [Micromonospora sp. NPDC048905]|uniref:hypothetical protein n=1 Tax=Micromonospora sp. NPDC048905 TaxID=3155494 RepID=UPI0033CD5362